MAATKNLKGFALNVLYIYDELPPLTPQGNQWSFRDVWRIYNERVGAANIVVFDKFKSMIVDAWQAGYLELGGAYITGSRYETGIPADDTIELTQKVEAKYTNRGKDKEFKGRWYKLTNVQGSIKKLVTELEEEAWGYVNQNIHDAFIRHQIHLLRVSGAMRNEITALLDKTEKDLAEQIRKRLDGHAGAASLGTRRMKLLEEYVRFLRQNAWAEVNAAWLKNLTDMAKAEPGFIAGLIQSASPVALSFTLPDSSLIQGIVKNNPFEGRVLKDWANDIKEQDIQRILSQIRIGMLQGESSAQIASRIVGTAEMKGSNGVTEITRRNAAAITRTAVMAISNDVRTAFYEANSDILEKERFVATLDSRTTPVCRANDGKVFDIGTGPKPPLHFNCRSLRVPYFLEGALGDRPARNFTQKQLLREYAEENDLDLPRTRADLPRGYKTGFDDFARKRMRELTSVVPASENFNTFLRRQTKDIQDDILGVTRARLFRAGKLNMDSFVDKSGRTYTLRELASKYRAIFAEAGLEPEDFL